MQTELDQFDNMTPSLTLEPELEAAPMPMVRVRSSYTPSPMCARPSMLMLLMSRSSILGQK